MKVTRNTFKLALTPISSAFQSAESEVQYATKSVFHC